ERVAINVSGLRFETYESTLIKHPNTLLGNRARRDRYYDYERKEYFFDRHRQSFEAILYYYQSEGRLNRPSTVPWDIFYEELCFFQIEPEVLSHLRKVEGMEEDPAPLLPQNKIKRRIWLLFEYPDTSMMAKCVAFFSMAIILLSVAVFCLETVDGFNVNFRNKSNVTVEQNRTATRNADALYNVETMCVVWFTFELIIRFLACPSKWKFVISPMNIIDFLAIMPYYITLIMRTNGNPNVTTVEALRVLRLARVLRIFKLSRHSSGLQTLGKTFKSSMNELFMLGCILVICVILFSSFVYFFEYERNGKEFQSIPHAFWWAVITMTTVGYGDISPRTGLGQIIGSLCAVTGVLCIALPVPIIVSNFTYYY
ncbi:uncharacterized protein TRIADDRAFT_2482, partial [Trichoplax adhaerens]